MGHFLITGSNDVGLAEKVIRLTVRNSSLYLEKIEELSVSYSYMCDASASSIYERSTDNSQFYMELK